MPKRTGNWMTVAEFCEELDIARTTFDDWRAKQRAPKCVRLPNGSLRIRRTDFDSWINALEDNVA
ncbi:putative DNA-binding transcriptional regulator AlpA [Saccharopolyspora lacisalsi]|uniref:Putative DNA-binding transcriptional regulator AlpA n=1 Tax=Halosaccharopolyspora lacisalsi TaxID=1000566 RepID=A0A839E1E9_9PSEU|nr:helix-turn-helix domain-containing protein [Halosaccharopolyspora lacisalsi]MBA8827103.1 putative DNA-binding transcriptional regulator AlpA [Halosaccharopolyspora lacisalsi]